MTCCIGISTPEGILVAADTCVQSGAMVYERENKIYRGKRGLLATSGASGMVEMIAGDWVTAGGGLDTLVKLLRQDLRQKPDGIEGAFIWAGREGLRALDGCGSATRSRYQFVAVGSGEEIAMGFMGGRPSVATLADAEKLARDALKFVSAVVCNVRPPFQVEAWAARRARRLP